MDVKLLIFLLLLAIINAEYKSYKNYKVYKIVPITKNDLNIIKEIKTQKHMFWTDVEKENDTARIMVAPERQTEFEEHLKRADIYFEIIFQDLQKLIDTALQPSRKLSRKIEALHSMTWDRYYTLEEIYHWFDELKVAYPNVVDTVVMGHSIENRDIKGVKINFNPGITKHIGMLEGTIHAREWISTTTLTWIIKEFLTNTHSDVRALAENFEWHIFPVVNPDGYRYTFTDDRLWRKNRNTQNKTCPGVDLNRNFGYKWMSIGASSNNCDYGYAGTSAFSEPESSAIAQYVNKLKEQGNLIYYIALHSFNQIICVPYSHVAVGDNASMASNYDDMYKISARGAAKLAERYGTQYRTGLAASLMYPMSGASFDWVKAEANVPISYLIELRDTGDYGFILLPDQIIPNGLEMMDFILEMDRATKELKYYSSNGNSIISCCLIVVLSFLFTTFK